MISKRQMPVALRTSGGRLKSSFNCPMGTLPTYTYPSDSWIWADTHMTIITHSGVINRSPVSASYIYSMQANNNISLFAIQVSLFIQFMYNNMGWSYANKRVMYSQ